MFNILSKEIVLGNNKVKNTFKPLIKYVTPKKVTYKKSTIPKNKNYDKEVEYVESWKTNLENLNDLYNDFKKQFESSFNIELESLKIHHKRAYYNHAKHVLKLSEEELNHMFENYKPSFLDFLK